MNNEKNKINIETERSIIATDKDDAISKLKELIPADELLCEATIKIGRAVKTGKPVYNVKATCCNLTIEDLFPNVENC